MPDLRDRYLAHLSGEAPGDPDAIRAALAAAPDVPLQEMEGLSLAPTPSLRFRSVRFLDRALLDDAHRSRFACPTALPHLAAAFVDPVEYHFRTFENILPLDRLFVEPSLSLKKQPGGPRGVTTFAVQATLGTFQALTRLDSLGLYVPPLNDDVRGGKRFIFHAAALAEALTEALRPVLPDRLKKTFVHVNPVFRCSRFEPDDAPFEAHHDTPYCDPARGHLSTHTLLLYITGGQGDPALSVGGGAIERIEAMSLVMFHQRYRHAGRPFKDVPKVFLRTELIVKSPPLTHEPQLGRAFARANYLTGERALFPELAPYTADLYNRVARAHWEGWTGPEDDSEPFLHKEYEGTHFIANGHDFWFPPGTPLQECAALAILDHFNAKITWGTFRGDAKSTVIHGHRDAAWIPAFLARQDSRPPDFPGLDKEALYPPPEESDPEQCCPKHSDEFQPAHNTDVIDLLVEAQDRSRRRILPAAILLMGEEVLLDRSRLVVGDGRITLLSEKRLAPVNFAAMDFNHDPCEGGDGVDHVALDLAVSTLRVLLPPILFTETDGCIHLMLDFFRNTWMVEYRQELVGVPCVVRESAGRTMWIDFEDEMVSDED